MDENKVPVLSFTEVKYRSLSVSEIQLAEVQVSLGLDV